MRLLFTMTTPYLPESTGGVQSTTDELCSLLQRRGHQVAVLAGLRKRGRFARRLWLGRATGGDGQVAQDETRGYPAYRSRTPVDALAEICARFAPDAAVVQLGQLMPQALRLVGLGVPTIVCVHNLEFAHMGGEPVGDPRLQFVVTCRYAAETLRRRCGIDAAVLPPLVMTERYRTATTRETATFVNPVPVKGLEVALALAARRPDIPFQFAEAWPLKRSARWRLHRRLLGRRNVRFLRRAADMRPVYARTRLLLAPSQWQEVWGRVVTEAQLNGIPALASAVGGMPEAVGPGGMLVAPQAPIEEWAAALARLWDDRGVYEDCAAKARLHADRPEIQADGLLDRFVALVERQRQAGAAP